eukprot:m.133056 g.133056  ORF g.133056 m.133056 type:complete len:218 (-) comp16872_c0_seq2:146-799(-)
MQLATAVTVLCLVAAAHGYVDFTVDKKTLKRSFNIDKQTFSSGSCAVREGCVGGPGRRKLLKFDVGIRNEGTSDHKEGNPSSGRQFEWDSCHQHYHRSGVGQYTLYKKNGNEAVAGHKQAFCMEDTEPFSGRAGAKRFTCQNQGISSGWMDVYRQHLDCQWIDVTGLKRTTYDLCVHINPEGEIPDEPSRYRNNNRLCARIRITKKNQVKFKKWVNR